MTHELTQTTAGTYEMAYVGETPWHGLGQKLEDGAPIERWVEQAGMAWTIRKSAVQYYADRAQTKLVQHPDQVVLTRSDNGAPLGIVSSAYNIVQPFEVLEFFRDLVAGGGFKLETAGTMFGGRRYWALAKIAEATVVGWDKIGGFLLLTTSSDGSFASEARETTVRVVCNNTISLAVAQIPGRHYVKINHRQVFDANAVKSQLELGAEHFAAFHAYAESLAHARITAAAAEAFVTELLRPGSIESSDEDEAEEEQRRRPRGLDTILSLFNGAGMGSEEKGSRGTAWGLVNAVTEYVDHHATAKSIDHRLNRAWYGVGDKLKVAAFEAAIEQFI